VVAVFSPPRQPAGAVLTGPVEVPDEPSVTVVPDVPLREDAPDAPGSRLPAAAELGGAVAGSGAPITIQKDCQVAVTVKEDTTLNGTYTVNEYGAIQLGYIGPIIIINKTEGEAAVKIRSTLEGRSFKTATVSVELQRASYENVLVTGGVTQEGLIKIGAGDTILLNDALLRAGGVRIPVQTARVRVVRGGRLSAVALAMPGEIYNLVDETGAPQVPTVTLRNNDVVYVYSEQAGVGLVGTGRVDVAFGGAASGQVAAPEITVLVLGEVNRPGKYAIGGKDAPTMMNLVFKMGGLPAYANAKAVRLIRRDRKGVEKETVIDVNKIMDRGDPDLDVRLEDGDRIVVPARRITLF
jgi:protein involved in polysaccharide export with SLBB domain